MGKLDYKLTPAERETIITFNDADNSAQVYSTSPVFINKLKTFARKQGLSVLESDHSCELMIPKNAVKLAAPLVLSDEERSRRVSHMKALRSQS